MINLKYSNRNKVPEKWKNEYRKGLIVDTDVSISIKDLHVNGCLFVIENGFLIGG